MSTRHGTLEPGERVGGFVVDRLLGTGGSGQVYEVHDAERARPIALKLLPRATIAQRPDFVQPFQREYHRLLLLRHPRIVEVYRYGSDVHGLYYTMELVDGPELRGALPLAWREACTLLRDIALSLAIVHSRRLVHRDVGPGNVRLGRDGRAKLLDFGATVSMGIPCDLVGTPPCTPPEAFAYEPLDARADLFGLGALGYYLLSGEHAYPGSSVATLLARWDAPLAPPSAHVAEIPAALDRLIVSLLQRDRRLRPHSATEVINHLEAIAQLAPVPAAEAAQTSFVAPALVGRTAEVHLLCCHVAAARGGKGSALLIESAAGQGRTRLLQQLVVEASQPNVIVLELDSRSASEPADGSELFDSIRQQATELARLAGSELPRATADRIEALPDAPARQAPADAARELLRALTERFTLVLLADDVQAWEEPALGLLASLASDAHEQRLLIVATRQLGAPVRAPYATQLLARHAHRLLLEPLSIQAVEDLVRSAFVDARQVKFVSDWVAGLSQGNPSKIVELLRHLVDDGRVEFRDGAWILPEHIDPSLLPHDLAAALRGRIASLSPAARELAQLLCVLVRPLDKGIVRALVQAAEAEDPASATLRVLDELSSADVIAIQSGTVAIARPFVREILRDSMSPQALRAAHVRVGRSLALRFGTDDYDASVDLPTAYTWAVSGYHLLQGGEWQRGVRLWLNALRYTFEVDYVPIWDGNAWYADCNRLALQAARELQLSPTKVASLSIAAVQSSIDPSAEILDAGEATLRALARASGLLDYAQPAQIADPAARIVRAMQAARERWLEAPAATRGVEPGTACVLLFRLIVGLSFSYYHTLNAAKLADLPGMLTPFAPLAPICLAFAQMIEGIRAYVAGRTQRELELRLEALAAMDGPSMRAGVTETMRGHLRGLWLYAIAAIETVRDPRAGLRRIEQMEAETPFMTFGAWQLRLLCHIHEGNALDAQACAERMELATVQDNTVAKQVLHASGLPPLAAAYALAGDNAGLRATIDKLEPYAQSVTSWRPFHDAALAHHHLLRGQSAEAQRCAERALSQAPAGEHRAHGFALLALLGSLLDQQHNAAAHSCACEALARAAEHALGPELESQLCAHDALALARQGEGEHARRRGLRALEVARAAGLSGLLLAETQRALARVAVLRRDGAAFEQHAAQVARLTCAHEHPGLLARYKRLLAEAHEAGVAYSGERAGAAILQRPTDLQARLRAELERSSLLRSLPERVLELMVQHAGVSSGYLFALEEARLRCTAPEQAAVPAGLCEALQACLVAEHAVTQRGARNTLTATRTSIVRLDDGQLFQVAVLHREDDDGVLRAAGAIALRVRDTLPAVPRWDCVLALSTVLGASSP